MKFGRIDSATAAGAILAHGVPVPGGMFKKGRVLTDDDVAQLKAAAVSHVVAARLEAGDVHEDAAANALAEASAGDGVRAAAAFTGRANLIAEVMGVVVIDPARVTAVNSVDEALTIATVPAFAVVRPRQMVATIKVIPFSAPEGAVAAAAAAARAGGPLVRVAPLRDQPAGLVMTRLKSTKESVLDKTTVTVRDRLERLGAHLAQEIRCDHTEEAVAAAVATLAAKGCRPILVIGASAIVDRRDIVPAGIVRAGGAVDRFGMPVDPGNLLLMAHLGDIPVIGAPGCARSPKTNGFDWVLARVLAGLAVGDREIQGMAAGGLLMEGAARPQEVAAHDEAPSAPQIAALVLAAGMSRRAGSNKLLATIEGKPLVTWVVDSVLATAARPVIVVTGNQDAEVQAALAGRDVTFVHNPRFAEGLSTSLRQGMRKLAEVAPKVDGALVCLGDMPSVRPQQLDRLISAFNPAEGRTICVPTFDGRRGNPVLWGHPYFAAMQEEVAGDTGARHLIGQHEDSVCEVAMTDGAIFLDLDTPEALAAAGATPAARNGTRP